MNPILRNILVTIAGIVVGSIVNGGIIVLSSSIIDYPDGFNPMDQESFEKYKDLIPVTGYYMALAAHALETLIGAFIVAKFVTTKNSWFAIGIAVFFLLGGIANLFSIPHPAWFAPTDLIVSYLPMGLLGWILAGSKKG